MTRTAALIATLLSSAAWSTDVATSAEPLPSRGAYLGFTTQTLAGPQNGLSPVSFDQMFWGTVQLGWCFGDRFFHGPELEVGWHRYRAIDSEGEPPTPYVGQSAHFGLGYRVGVDVWRAQAVAFFLAGRFTAGVVPGEVSIDPPLGQMYLQTDLTVGARVAVGPVRVRLGVGPVLQFYEWYAFLAVQAGLAVEL